ncbi:MAG: DUF4331 domain-containing protein [bacterium]
MSSHREAPEISKDPVADNTDVYAFVCPDDPGHATLIANFIPLQNPQSGPNFWEFGDDVVYRINISKRGKSQADVIFEFRFSTRIRNPNTFLYNTGPIKTLTDPTWNRPQTYSVRRWSRAAHVWRTLATGLTTPPVNVGERSTPNYAKLAAQAVHSLPGSRTVFAGQRAEGFHVDLGSIFDLGTLRPFAHLHLIPSADAVGVNGTQGLNVHSIALKVPLPELTPDYTLPKNALDPIATVGVWASAYRHRASIISPSGDRKGVGALVQVSRLGNPLFNEVIVPMAAKDRWNTVQPDADKAFAKYVLKPELAGLLPVLYPGVFPKLAAYTKPRVDLQAILLSGIPKGIVAGFQNYTGPVLADMLRLNIAVKPSSNPDPIGLIAGDAAGYPNGRRPIDDVVAIELRAIAGATIPLVDPNFTPDAASAGLTDGTTNTNPPFLAHFPYLGTPGGGSQSRPGVAKAS